MATYRGDRINGEMRREIAEILRLLKDPRIAGLTSVVDVSVTRDLKYAKVYISVFGTEEAGRKETLRGLQSSAGFVRQELKKRMKIRQIPELQFVLDDSIAYGAHINEVIRSIEQEAPSSETKENEEN